MDSPIIGILSGVGALPVVAAKEAKRQGYRCVVIALFPENKDQLQEYADAYYLVNPGELGKVIEIFRREDISEIVLLGKVSKQILYSDFRPDAHWLSVFQNLTGKNDDALLLAIVNKLDEYGIVVREQALFLQDYILELGVKTERQPTEEEVANIIYGYPLAKGLAGLDIGQAVAISKGAVMAVEAIDGTNATILRGGKLAKGPVTALKVSKPHQDFRFDIPVIGFDTIESLYLAGGGTLALEANQVFFLDMEESIDFANERNITICAFNPQKVLTGLPQIFQEAD